MRYSKRCKFNNKFIKLSNLNRILDSVQKIIDRIDKFIKLYVYIYDESENDAYRCMHYTVASYET